MAEAFFLEVDRTTAVVAEEAEVFLCFPLLMLLVLDASLLFGPFAAATEERVALLLVGDAMTEDSNEDEGEEGAARASAMIAFGLIRRISLFLSFFPSVLWGSLVLVYAPPIG